MPDLTLEGRDGLPDDLAYLRATYTKEDWRAHSNFGELSNFWLQVHDGLRNHGKHLDEVTSTFRDGRLDPLSYRQNFAQSLNQFLQHLNGHHQIEDRHYFPKFRSLDARMLPGFELLERDHQAIHSALLTSAEAANRFLAAFSQGADALMRGGDAYAAQSSRLLALLMRHLADEEDLVIPAMLHHGERPLR